MYDLMIIGAGPGGYTAANKAAAGGLKVVLFEKREIGGTCLNRGCIPMKSLIASANLYEDARNGDLFGIGCEGISFSYEGILERKDHVVDTLKKGIVKSLEGNKVEIVKGKATLKDPTHVECNGEIYEGRNIIIATGSVPSLPPIEGIGHAITSDRILEDNIVLPGSMTIIGGGVIGVEIADALSSLGCRITIIEMFEHLLPGLDRDLGQRLAMFFKKKGIEVICQAAVSSIEFTGQNKIVRYTDRKGASLAVESTEVLVATGRKTNLEGISDTLPELKIDRGVVADDIGRTSIDNIYVIGDARSMNIQLAHVAEAQGENIVDHLLGRPLSNDLSVIPSGVYTRPEIASVGISEKQAKEKGLDVQTRKYLTGANGKSLIENSDSGFVKLITENDVIIGGQIVSLHATELIGELAIAVQKKMTVEEFACVVHPHPSISEMLWNVAKQ